MLKKTIIALSFVLSIGPLLAQSNQEKLALFFKLSDYYLKRHVYNGLVNYEYTSNNFKEMKLLHKTMAEVDLSGINEAEKRAFLINAYNILVIYQVAESYPLNSPSDREGFFDQETHNVAGEELTLNTLEKEQLLQTYGDARFHFVLACAAMSCPKLYNRAYTEDNVDKLLDERARVTLNDPSFIRIEEAQRKVAISKIFEWYEADFIANGQSVIAYINQYRDEKIPDNYQLTYYEYDWSLNERKL